MKAIDDRGMILMLLFFTGWSADRREHFRQGKKENMMGEVLSDALFFIRSVYGRADWDGRDGCPG